MAAPSPTPDPIPEQPRFRPFTIAAIGLTLAFAVPLTQLVLFATRSDLYSHIVLVPLVSVWLVWIRRTIVAGFQRRGAFGAAVCAAAAVAAIGYALLGSTSPQLEPNHALTWFTLGYVLSIASAAFWFLGGSFVRTHVVAVAFLIFMVPMPGWLELATETALQRGSAVAADLIFSLSSIPYFRDGQVFRLPSITMEIAQECSGIHSSLVLFIVSIVAGQLFLPPGWRRWTLTLAVIPLALVRNGFRVFTLGYLCENIGPHMIHHWIHHRGGPVFFALSLIPFFALLLVLRKRRTKCGDTPDTNPPISGNPGLGSTPRPG